MGSVAADEPKLKVFISYSRADEAFTDELVEGLEYGGEFEVSIDRQSIIEGEAWEPRLGALIADADTIVFVLSPNSAQSKTCAWEVEYAHELSKRILPVLWRPLGKTTAPDRLAALDYVRFDEERSFMKGLKSLVSALKTDIGWLREHTRLLARAREWNEVERPENRLLSGDLIAKAKEWAANRPKDAPEPTDLHMTFIRASEAAETARKDTELKRQAELAEAKAAAELQAEKARSRQRAIRLYAIAGGVSAILAVVAGWQALDAKKANNALDAALNAATKSLCEEATKVTNVLGTTTGPAEWDSSYAVFWSLFWGPMRSLEELEKKFSRVGLSNVEHAMVDFGSELDMDGRLGDPRAAEEVRSSGVDHAALRELADGVANACEKFIGKQ